MRQFSYDDAAAIYNQKVQRFAITFEPGHDLNDQTEKKNTEEEKISDLWKTLIPPTPHQEPSLRTPIMEVFTLGYV